MIALGFPRPVPHPVPPPARSAGLAGRAPEGDPVLLSRRADGGAAATARPAAPSVHPVLLAPLPVTCRYVAVPILVGLEQSPGQVNQGTEIRYRPGGLPRIDAAQEQHLGLVDIPYPGQVFLVEQRLSDRAVRLGAQSPHRLVGVPVAAQQIRAQVAGDLRLFAGADQFDDAEPVP